MPFTPLVPFRPFKPFVPFKPLVPEGVKAYSAYGTGVSGWRGDKVAKAVALPLVRTPISSQQFVPLKTVEPKSMAVVNAPLLTGVALFVTGPATATPVVLV